MYFRFIDNIKFVVLIHFYNYNLHDFLVMLHVFLQNDFFFYQNYILLDLIVIDFEHGQTSIDLLIFFFTSSINNTWCKKEYINLT